MSDVTRRAASILAVAVIGAAIGSALIVAAPMILIAVLDYLGIAASSLVSMP